MNPITLAILGVLAYRTYHGKGRLAEWMGHKGSDTIGREGVTGGGQELQKLISGIGAAGAPLAGGLSDLFKDFQEKGLGETIKSWVEHGTNKSLSSAQLEKALGSERIEWLLKETGMSREALLEGLSRELPTAVDQLTPEGRLPTEQEAAQQIRTPTSDATAAKLASYTT